jgi:toxin HigB-1
MGLPVSGNKFGILIRNVYFDCLANPSLRSNERVPSLFARTQGRMVPKGFPANLANMARRKLIMVDSVDFLAALNSPPGNRLEALKGDLAGKHSIRINNQWRVVFRWTDAGPEDVEIIDYH